jgi:hypothetical protein
VKSVLSEIVKIELLKSLISEGRVEDAKAKYSQDTDVIDYFVSQDPSGNNKYLPWMMKTYKQIPSDAPEGVRTQAKELIPNLIKGFHQNSARLEKKDINQYKSLGELFTVINPVIKAAEEKSVKKEKEEKGVLKLYEDADWLFLQPLEYEASCKYGANTQWCIASKDTSQHFKSYTKDGLLLFLIHKKSNNKFAFYISFDNGGSLEEAFNNVEIYNPIDTDISENGTGQVEEVDDFLSGLVQGNLEDYLAQNEGDYNDGDELVFYKIRTDGTRRHITTEYDSGDLHEYVLEELMEHLLPGKTTAIKGKRALNMVGLDFSLGKVKRGQPIPWLIHTLNNPKNVVDEGDNFKGFISDSGIDEIVEEALNDMDTYDMYTEVIKKNNLPYLIMGGDFDDEVTPKKEVISDGIMSEKQAKAILTKYNEIKDETISEEKRKIESAIKNLIEGIKIEDRYLEIASGCFERPGNFQSCMHRTSGVNPLLIEVRWRNPKSNRMLRRTINEVRIKFNRETGLNMGPLFVDTFFRELLKLRGIKK